MHSHCSSRFEKALSDFSDITSKARGGVYMKIIINEYFSDPGMQAMRERERDRI